MTFTFTCFPTWLFPYVGSSFLTSVFFLSTSALSSDSSFHLLPLLLFTPALSFSLQLFIFHPASLPQLLKTPALTYFSPIFGSSAKSPSIFGSISFAMTLKASSKSSEFEKYCLGSSRRREENSWTGMLYPRAFTTYIMGRQGEGKKERWHNMIKKRGNKSRNNIIRKKW